MKSLKTYITEAFKINKNTKLESRYKYFPKTKDELKEIIRNHIDEFGYECDLNDIDTSEITDMSILFSYTSTVNFNGDISKWNVSNVENMERMFEASEFNGDLSNWNTSKVKNMKGMFYNSDFNGDISNWDVSNVKNMERMFAYNRNFNQDISNWDVSNVTNYDKIFDKCTIEEKYIPKFK